MVRPKQFNNEKALNEAMQMFWTKGYDGTSLPDLLQCMNVSRSSLYNSYQDKQTLFHQTLTYYQQTIGASKREALTGAHSAKDGIRQYFYRLIKIALSEELPGGCFFTNVATSLETADENTRQRVYESLKSLEELFYNVLLRGLQMGEIDPNKDIRKKASLLLGLSQGINVLSRVYKEKELFENMINTALEEI
ncbi:TetR/AcrR family transcriptional regulator [Paenibacillus anseongense]|uniref:TetR/AcrR family transcriptional regulator n=1 Tax=Paenibacillus anseongense TaxID=2682845 RepID=UPI002DB731AB|nr:TetR/AcrR family transcriptional regulator [Paenibacillus anseongense]MEC0268313.1 TetR/AcrR family transcriptional regulator [Paenibacillus anseongense]